MSKTICEWTYLCDCVCALNVVNGVAFYTSVSMYSLINIFCCVRLQSLILIDVTCV